MLIRFLTLSTILTTVLFFCGCQSAGQPQSCGCQSDDLSSAHKATPQLLENDILSSDTALEGRLAAAIEIRVPSKRIEALTGFALDAAQRGKPKFVNKALTLIDVPGTRYEAASNCAFFLAMAGESEGAVMIANTIKVPELRTETLVRIATLK